MKKSQIQYGNIVIFVFYVMISFTGMIFHEPWRDEAQAWLLARDLSFGDLMREMGYDGSPALWHLLLMPIAKTGLPYFSMNVIHWLIACLSAFLVIFRSPFEKWFRYMLVFSYFLLYEYSIIARSYALSVLFLFLIAMLYGKRKEKPLIMAILIALLANTNTHSVFAAGALSLIFAYEYIKEGIGSLLKTRVILSFVIIATGFGLFLFQLIPPADSWKPGLLSGRDWPWIFDSIGHAFLPNYLSNPGMTLHFKHWSELLLLFLFFILVVIMVSKDKRMLFFYLFSAGGLFFIFVFKHSGYLRHYGFIYIYLIFSLWIGNYPELRKNLKDRIRDINKNTFLPIFVYCNLCLLLFGSCVSGFYSIYLDIDRLFSGSKEMAKIISVDFPRQKEIITYNIHTITAIIPYLEGTKFWDAGIEKNFTYIHWDSNYLPSRKLDQKEIYGRMRRYSAKTGNGLVLLPYPADFQQMPGLTLLRQVEDRVKGDEKYYLYEIKD